MNQQNQILLILDIDETLLYSSAQPLHRPPDCRIGPYFTYTRPFLTEFLQKAQESFCIAVWSSSSSDYVQAIVNKTFPDTVQPEFIWSRDRCIQRFNPETYENYFVKDLKKVKRQGYNLDRVLIVEDTPQKVERNYGNAIYIKPFYGNDNDQELKFLTEYLIKLRSTTNLREIEKRNWRQKIMH